MTDKIAIVLAIFLVILFGVDIFMYDFQYSTFLAKKFMELVWWLKFWR